MKDYSTHGVYKRNLLKACRKMLDGRDRFTLPDENRHYSKGWNQALNWVIAYIEYKDIK